MYMFSGLAEGLFGCYKEKDGCLNMVRGHVRG